jgi:phage terminase small subunit
MREGGREGGKRDKEKRKKEERKEGRKEYGTVTMKPPAYLSHTSKMFLKIKERRERERKEADRTFKVAGLPVRFSIVLGIQMTIWISLQY